MWTFHYTYTTNSEDVNDEDTDVSSFLISILSPNEVVYYKLCFQLSFFTPISGLFIKSYCLRMRETISHLHRRLYYLGLLTRHILHTPRLFSVNSHLLSITLSFFYFWLKTLQFHKSFLRSSDLPSPDTSIARSGSYWLINVYLLLVIFQLWFVAI